MFGMFPLKKVFKQNLIIVAWNTSWTIHLYFAVCRSLSCNKIFYFNFPELLIKKSLMIPKTHLSFSKWTLCLLFRINWKNSGIIAKKKNHQKPKTKVDLRPTSTHCRQNWGWATDQLSCHRRAKWSMTSMMLGEDWRMQRKIMKTGCLLRWEEWRDWTIWLRSLDISVIFTNGGHKEKTSTCQGMTTPMLLWATFW